MFVIPSMKAADGRCGIAGKADATSTRATSRQELRHETITNPITRARSGRDQALG